MSLRSSVRLARWALDLPNVLVLGILGLCTGVVFLGYWQWAIVPYAFVCARFGVVIGYHLRRLEERKEEGKGD